MYEPRYSPVTLGYGPVAEKTIWGWVLSGKLPVQCDSASSPTLVYSTSATSPSTSSMVSKSVICMNLGGLPLSELWSLETLGIRDAMETQSRHEIEIAVQQHFGENVKRLENGRYEVALPWILGFKERLPQNFSSALTRLKTTTKRLIKEDLFTSYNGLFEQWEADDMIERVGVIEVRNVQDSFESGGENTNITGMHYLPHRAVVKLSSATTPVRPVFDASAKPRGYPSLNDCVDKGPNYLELIPAILTRFRLQQVGAVADIKKAFQQISICPDDRNVLRFLWWEDNSCKKLRVYRHTRVVFGVSCSPYLLAATLQYHLVRPPMKDEEMEHQESETRLLLSKNMYVDNCVVSLPSHQAAYNFRDVSRKLLEPAQFDLRGWEFGPCNEDKSVPVLGIIWNLKEDTLALDLSSLLPPKEDEVHLTQRALLSLVHSIYDPLGLVSPFVLKGKVLLRSCHAHKLGWDKPLPSDLEKDARQWVKQVHLLESLRFPRHSYYGNSDNVSLHAFCDASNLAYAAVVFLRVECGDQVHVTLLQAKSRVAPQGKCSIPRLELLSCNIAARLAKTVVQDIGDPDLSVTLWTDSATALAWIQGDGPWGVFVHNRKKEINDLTKRYKWRHIPGKFNPADLPSRGCGAKALLSSNWWMGPKWLSQPNNEWPTSKVQPDPEKVNAEMKKTVVVSMDISDRQKDEFWNQFLKISSYPKILRVIALCQRFANLLKTAVRQRSAESTETRTQHSAQSSSFSSDLSSTGASSTDSPSFSGASSTSTYSSSSIVPLLTVRDLESAEKLLLFHVQSLLRDEPGRLKNLELFENEDGLLRVRTRLVGEEDETFHQPILLPNRNPFVDRLIRWEHDNHCHLGTGMLHALLREHYWILRGPRTIRKVISKCWICQRWNSRPIQVPAANLPTARTEQCVPFNVTGVDIAGPLLLKPVKKDPSKKVWILLFTCAVYRAVHLEVVQSLSTDDFLAALRRFIARRCRPNIIYSDNGLNFVGASRAINNLDWDRVQSYATVNRIQWRFNPPTGAWWGGWWERLIGLAKLLLKKILGKRAVHLDELTTLIVEVEEAMNNRPLTHSSESPMDPQPLTPNYFIKTGVVMGRRDTQSFPEGDVIDATHLRAAHKKLQHLREALRSRFRREYLGKLHHKQRSMKPTTLKVGDVVLIEQDNVKRQDWQLARITGLISGPDGETRLYRLRWKGGETTRPAQRLFPMEVNEETSSE